MEFDLTSGNTFANRIVSHIDVFDLGMEGRVLCENNSTVVVAHQRRHRELGKVKLKKEHAEPGDLFTSLRGCDIFGFASGKGNGLLLTCTPGNETTAKRATITTDRMPRVDTAPEIAISVSKKAGSMITSKDKRECASTLQIVNNSLGCFPVHTPIRVEKFA
jgi:hypothetical protein